HASILAIDLARDSGDWDVSTWDQIASAALQHASGAGHGSRIWIVVRPDLDFDEAERRIKLAQSRGVGGVMVDGGVRDDRPGWRRMGRPVRDRAIGMVRVLRQRFGDDLAIAASGGVHEPADALDFLSAGANLVAIDSGLVYSGPGLAKRVNDALLH